MADVPGASGRSVKPYAEGWVLAGWHTGRDARAHLRRVQHSTFGPQLTGETLCRRFVGAGPLPSAGPNDLRCIVCGREARRADARGGEP